MVTALRRRCVSSYRRRGRLAIRRRVEAEALDPALDLLAVLVERARDGGDVALMLAERGDDLVADLLVHLREHDRPRRARRTARTHGVRKVFRAYRFVAGEDLRGRERLLELADVERPRIAEQQARGV